MVEVFYPIGNASPAALRSALLLAYTPGWRKAAQFYDQPGYPCDDRFKRTLGGLRA